MAMTSQGGTVKLQGWKAPQRGAIICFAICLLLVSMVALTSAASQTWYLSGKGDGTVKDHTMYRGSLQGTSGEKRLSFQEVYTWRADENASTDVTFAPGTWVINIYKKGTEAKPFSAYIGVLNDSVFTAYGTYSDHVSPGSNTFNISTSSFTVHEGEWLAYRMIYTGGSGSMTIVTAGGLCNITSPPGSGDYPIPEVSTIVLFGVGLLALVGYVGYRKRT